MRPNDELSSERGNRPSIQKPKVRPHTAIALACLEAAMPKGLKTQVKREALAILVQVPDASWSEAVVTGLKRHLPFPQPPSWIRVQKKDLIPHRSTSRRSRARWREGTARSSPPQARMLVSTRPLQLLPMSRSRSRRRRPLYWLSSCARLLGGGAKGSLVRRSRRVCATASIWTRSPWHSGLVPHLRMLSGA